LFRDTGVGFNPYDVSVTQSSFQGNAKALVKGEAQGFIKIVTDKAY
jgi:dihydrolipoamide dehydrogenase